MEPKRINRRTRTRLRIAFLIAAIAVVSAILIKKTTNPKESPSSQNDSIPQETGYSLKSIENTRARIDQEASQLEATSLSSIEDERVVTFEDLAAFEAFLNSSPNDAYEIIASNETILSVRLRTQGGTSPEIEGAKSDPNYTLLTPLPIPTQQFEGDTVFAHTALDFMRAPSDVKNLGSGVTIAILDTGILSHPTLANSQIESVDLFEGAEFSPHGTAVASLIGSANGLGVAPGANLLSIRVLDTEGIGDTFTLADGIVKAVDAGAQIINMSLGSYGSNQALSNAVSYAAAKGVVLVAAAGNEGVTALPYPAAYGSVIAVTAIDANGHPTDFANQSSEIDLAAPGVGVYAAWEDEDWISFSGTSAATPLVSGAIAAISSEMGISASEAASVLISNANDAGVPGIDSQSGAGYVDIQRTLDSNTSYLDLALADIYLDPISTENGQNTIYLSVQNRGTESVSAAYLNYRQSNGIEQRVYLGSLQPGQTESITLRVQSVEIAKSNGYLIDASVETGGSEKDTYPNNDERQLELKPVEPLD